jgi:hypothetical protein
MEKHLDSSVNEVEIHEDEKSNPGYAKDSIMDSANQDRFIATQQLEKVFGNYSSDFTSTSSPYSSLITSLSQTLNASVDHPRVDMLANGDDFIGTNETLHTLDISPSFLASEEGPGINEVPKIFLMFFTSEIN